MTWVSQIFVGCAVLLFIGVIVFGILITRNDGAGFNALMSDESNNPFSLSK